MLLSMKYYEMLEKNTKQSALATMLRNLIVMQRSIIT